MTNQYFLMRHGESESNVLGLIACDPVDSVAKYGLTQKGRQQVLESAGIFASEHVSKPVIISSDGYVSEILGGLLGKALITMRKFGTLAIKIQKLHRLTPSQVSRCLIGSSPS